MRFVILADPLDNQKAGIHHYTRNLVMQINKLDQDGEYVLIRRKRDKLFDPGRQVIIKNFRFPGYAALRMFFIIPWKIRQLKADAVIEPAHFGPFNLPRKIKRVTVIHDLTPILFPIYHRFHSQLLQRIFLRSILRRASLVIANSENTRKDIVRHYSGTNAKTISIYLGRDEGISPAVGGNESTEDAGKAIHKAKYFLYLGTIEPRKNLNCLLEAYALYKKHDHADHSLIIAGNKGWKSSSFFAKLQAHPNRRDIELLGYVDRDKLGELYQHATSFIFPSYYEGFGLPVVEAMSCGTPCLLSNSSSLPEVGGDAALYFDPQKPEELAALMLKITEDMDLHETLSKRAMLQAGKFSWEGYAIKFDATLRKICSA
ncbi:MAG TPA: glycosyltransferase family 1 protein [Bacteroidales bacterium]|nr:glycosyltransferase family 1 protein [Bacteroidales bacterium]